VGVVGGVWPTARLWFFGAGFGGDVWSFASRLYWTQKMQVQDVKTRGC
jgi:hypothetical protein